MGIGKTAPEILIGFPGFFIVPYFLRIPFSDKKIIFIALLYVKMYYGDIMEIIWEIIHIIPASVIVSMR